MLLKRANSSLVFAKVYSLHLISHMSTSLQPLVNNLVESIWMSFPVCPGEFVRYIYIPVYFLVLFSSMSLYAVILACHYK